MPEEWITVKEAAEALGISERQVRHKAAIGKLKARKDKNKWLIHHSFAEVESEAVGGPSEVSELPSEVIHRLESESKWLRERVEELEKQLADASERHDTIVLQLTRQLEQSQRLLEYHQEPWYRRWFRGKRAGDTQ